MCDVKHNVQSPEMLLWIPGLGLEKAKLVTKLEIYICMYIHMNTYKYYTQEVYEHVYVYIHKHIWLSG